jgi:hypothetical protein
MRPSSHAAIGLARTRDGGFGEPSLGSSQVDDPNAWLAVQIEWGDCEEVTSLVASQHCDHDRLPRPHLQPELVSDNHPVLLGTVSKRFVRRERRRHETSYSARSSGSLTRQSGTNHHRMPERTV